MVFCLRREARGWQLWICLHLCEFVPHHWWWPATFSIMSSLYKISLSPMHHHSTSSFSNLACPPYSISMLISVVSVQIRDEMEQEIFLMGFCRIRSFIQGMTESSCFTIGYKFSYDLFYDSIVYRYHKETKFCFHLRSYSSFHTNLQVVSTTF